MRYIDPANPVNWDCSLNRGLVSWWLALPDQQRGLYWRDLCGRAVGTLTNMDPATDWVGNNGRPGGFGALDFDGTNDYVVATGGASRLAGSGVFTVSFWAAGPYDSGTDCAFSVVNGTSLTNALIIYPFDIGGGGNGLRVYWDPSGDVININSGAPPASQWAMFTMTSVSGAQKYYVNGSSVGTSAVSRTLPSGTPDFNFGRWGGQYYGGLFDDAAAWNRALSASEVLALYNDSRRGHPEMLNWVRPAYLFDSGAAPPAGGIVRQMLQMAG